MRDDLTCEFPDSDVGTAILDGLARVLDPELDEPILDLGFVRSVRMPDGRACAALRLPTSWCAVNFAFLMAEDVRRALLSVDGIRGATVSLGDHCAAAEIEAAVNTGRPFAEAFPDAGGGGMAALRRNFLRKGFLIRQERLLRELRAAGCSGPTLCALRLDEVSIRDDAVVIRQSGAAPVAGGSAAILRRYLERRAELGLDCSPAASLFVDLDGRPFSAERLSDHYEVARTVRVALEANGFFCRALADLRRSEASGHAREGGGKHV